MAHSSYLLPCHPPFSLELTVWALRRRPGNIVDTWDDGIWSRVVRTSTGLRVLRARQAGPQAVEVWLDGGNVIDEDWAHVQTLAQRMLGLLVPLGPFYERLEDYPRLAGVAKALVGLKPPRYPDLFEALVNAVAFQQVSLAAATAIVMRYVRQYGDVVSIDGQTYHAFPTAEATVEASLDELRALGFSRQKALVIAELARRMVADMVSEDEILALPDDEAIAALCALPGIGPWSAQLVLLRGLGRLSVFPLSDSGARGRLATLLDLPDGVNAKREQEILEPLGEWRGMLYFYVLVWGVLQQGWAVSVDR